MPIFTWVIKMFTSVSFIFRGSSFTYSRLFALTEDKTTGKWKDEELCFGDDKYCTDNLSGEFERFILSFGEDEHGKRIYIFPYNQGFIPMVTFVVCFCFQIL